jgi:hypothetical protein
MVRRIWPVSRGRELVFSEMNPEMRVPKWARVRHEVESIIRLVESGHRRRAAGFSDERDPNIADHGYDLLRYAIAVRPGVPSDRSIRAGGTFAAAQRAVRRNRQAMTDSLEHRADGVVLDPVQLVGSADVRVVERHLVQSTQIGRHRTDIVLTCIARVSEVPLRFGNVVREGIFGFGTPAPPIDGPRWRWGREGESLVLHGSDSR